LAVNSQSAESQAAEQTAGPQTGEGGQQTAEDPEYARQIDQYIEKLPTSEGLKFRCRACPNLFPSKVKATIAAHVEATHLQPSLYCHGCNKPFKSRSYLRQHLKMGVCRK